MLPSASHVGRVVMEWDPSRSEQSLNGTLAVRSLFRRARTTEMESRTRRRHVHRRRGRCAQLSCLCLRFRDPPFHPFRFLRGHLSLLNPNMTPPHVITLAAPLALVPFVLPPPLNETTRFCITRIPVSWRSLPPHVQSVP